MNRDLDPITPDAALDYYLDARQYELRPATIETHTRRLQSFVDWLQSEGIHNMNDVDLRTIHAYRVYKREDNGEHDPCNSVTMQGQVSTLRRFLHHLVDIDAVPDKLPDRIRLPRVSDDEQSDDRKLDAGRARAILEYLYQFQYASVQHVTLLVLWRTSCRRGDLRALDVGDFDRDDSALCFRHRPKTGTPLKNGANGERDVSLKPHVERVIADYLENPDRHKVTDEHGRYPLLTTAQGRPHVGTIQNWVYTITRPCEIGEPCPHDYEISECEFRLHGKASGCPSSLSPHPVRTGSITAHRDSGVPREVVSDRGDVSERILEKHYDKASKRQRMRRRRSFIPDEI